MEERMLLKLLCDLSMKRADLLEEVVDQLLAGDEEPDSDLVLRAEDVKGWTTAIAADLPTAPLGVLVDPPITLTEVTDALRDQGKRLLEVLVGLGAPRGDTAHALGSHDMAILNRITQGRTFKWADP